MPVFLQLSQRKMKFAILAILLASGLRNSSYSQELKEPENRSLSSFLENYCLDCHDGDTQKGNLSLENLQLKIHDEVSLETWRLVYEQIQFRDMPPKRKKQPSSKERRSALNKIHSELLKTQEPSYSQIDKLQLPEFGNYVDHQKLFKQRRSHVTPAPPRIWRLRPDIYDRSIPNLAERVQGLANGLTLKDGSGFKDYAITYFLDEASTRTLLNNAKRITKGMVSERSKVKSFKRLVQEAPPPSEKQIHSAIQDGFQRVLDRVPTTEEKGRFFRFYLKAKEIGGIQSAGQAVLTAILMQPEVLFRQELGEGEIDEHGRIRLSSSEAAIAMSYALADAPISEFLSASKEKKFLTSETVAQLLRKSLASEKLFEEHPRIIEFFREYFHYPFVTEVFKDKPDDYGIHDPGLLLGDLELSIKDILVSDQQVLKTLLTTRSFYVNVTRRYDKKLRKETLQKSHKNKWNYHLSFNLPLDWKWSLSQQPVAFPKEERAGLLTHPAWLAAWSGNFENHPVQRGKWVRTHLLGGSVPDVPIGVDARVPEDPHKTFRQRLEETTKKAECWRCHRNMDPLGVVFERYDHYGRYRRVEAQQSVDSSGEISRTGIADLDGKKVANPVELMEILSESQHVEQVFVRHAFRFFLGRNESLGDANTLQDAHRAYRDSNGSFKELIVSLLSSESFLLRQVRKPRSP